MEGKISCGDGQDVEFSQSISLSFTSQTAGRIESDGAKGSLLRIRNRLLNVSILRKNSMQLIDLAVHAALKAGELLSKPTERVEIFTRVPSIWLHSMIVGVRRLFVKFCKKVVFPYWQKNKVFERESFSVVIQFYKCSLDHRPD